MILWSGAVGVTVNLKEPFVMNLKPTKDWGQAQGTQEFFFLEWVAEWTMHKGHSEVCDLVYRISNAEAAKLELLFSDIRKRKPFQPFLALQDMLPANFVSSQLQFGSCNGKQVSKVLPVSMETGKQHQMDGHAPRWQGRHVAQEVETRCCILQRQAESCKNEVE